MENLEEAKPTIGFIIIVNGRKNRWAGKKISFDELVKLAFGNEPIGDDMAVTIMYSNGPKPNSAGKLVEGQSVFVGQEMIFNVNRTRRS